MPNHFLRRGFMALLLGAAGVGLLTLPAHAHAQLVDSDPQEGQTLTESPSEITLEFNEKMVDIKPAINIRDADENVVFEGDPVVEREKITATVDQPLSSGQYSVVWRAVSADGHPIKGVIEFAIEADDEAEAPVAPAEEPSDDSAGDRLPTLYWIGGAAIVIVAIISYLIWRSRRNSRS